MKIAFDLDDVLLEVTPLFLQWYNQKKGTSFRYEDIQTYHYGEALGFSKEEEAALIDEFALQDTLYRQPADPQAKKTVRRLSRKSELYIITSRFTALEKCEDWVRREFGTIFKSIIFKNRQGSVDDEKPPKWQVAQEQGIRILVDDALHHLIPAAERGLGAIILDKPWNREEVPGVLRAHNWRELEGHIEEIRRQKLKGKG